MERVVDALTVDTYHDDEVDADLTAFKIEKGKLYFNAVSYHLDDWVQLDSWSTRKINEIIRKTISAAKEYSEVWIPHGAFKWRDKVRMIIPEGVIGIGEYAFLGCGKLKTLQIPDSVLYILEGAFSGCHSLTKVRIPEGVTKIFPKTFADCTKLSEIHIPNGLTMIGASAFSGCSALTEIRIPDGVTEIGDGAFSGCYKLKRATIPSSVTQIGKEAFRFCSNLTEILLPEGVTEIGKSAFQGCSDLSRIHIPASLVRVGADAFKDCPSIDEITVSPGNSAFDSRQQCNALVDSATGTLIQGSNKAFIPDGVTKISDHAFYGRKGIVEIHIPDSVTEIGEKAFFGCSGLTQVHIPGSVTHIGEEAFKGCAFIPEGMTEIEYDWFSNITKLDKLIIPASITKIEPEYLHLPAQIKEITVSPDNDKYDSRDNCNGIVETASSVLVVGCENTVIPDSVTEIGKAAFCGCLGLREIRIPKGVTKIGEGAFADCVDLCNVIIPDTVAEVGENAFYGCRNLHSLLAPKGLDLRAAKVPRRKNDSIIKRYSHKIQALSTDKAYVLTIPSGASIPIEYNEHLNGQIVITNWPLILEASSTIAKDEIETALADFNCLSRPDADHPVSEFVLTVIDVLKGGYDRLPGILGGLANISNSEIRDKLVSVLMPVLDTLTERERFIVESAYGIGRPVMSYEAIGRILGFTGERVRQIMEKAKRRLRHQVERETNKKSE